MSGRPGWAQLPRHVRDGVEALLGEPVVAAETQPGGFSPGSADRVRLASGRRAFVKAVSADVNATSVVLHRREAAITAALPPRLPAPRLLGAYDDGTWVALALADVAGRHPQLPWTDADVALVLAALAGISTVPLPAGVELPRSEDSLHGAFLGWEKLRKRPMSGLDGWAAANLGMLAELAHSGTAAMAGESLVHGDLRADNIMLADGGAVFVDWPHANRGAPWLDALSVLIDVNTDHPGGHAESLLAASAALSGVDRRPVTGVLAGWAGYYLDMSRRDPPPGITTLRAFQRQQGDALIRWLKLRLPVTR